MGEIDPTPRDLHLHESLSADSATRAHSDQRFRSTEGLVLQTDVRRRIRNETIAGIIALIGIAVFIYIFFFVIA